MFYIAEEIIKSEISSWDSPISAYKEVVELITEIQKYLSKKENSELENSVNKLSKQLEVYEEIYKIIGNSTQEFFTKLGVPDAGLIKQLNHAPTRELINELTKICFPEIEEDKKFKNEDIVNDDEKILFMTLALVKMLCNDQFFKLCELRKKALMNYTNRMSALQDVITNLPKDIQSSNPNKYQFTSLESLFGAVMQRFARYELLANPLKEKLKLVETNSKDSPLYLAIKFADIFSDLGKSYSIWDNKARFISEKSDRTKIADDKHQIDQLKFYEENIKRDQAEIGNKIKNVQLKLEKLENPIGLSIFLNKSKKQKLIDDFKIELGNLKQLYDKCDTGLSVVSQSLSKLIAKVVRDEMIEAQKTEVFIENCRINAAKLLEATYEKFNITPPSFHRNIALNKAYIPENKKQEVSSNKNEAPRRKASFSSFSSFIVNMKNSIKRTNSEEEITIKRTNEEEIIINEIPTITNSTNNPIQEIVNRDDKKILNQTDDKEEVRNKTTMKYPPIKKLTISEKFLANLKQQEEEKKPNKLEDKNFEIHTKVRSKIESFEDMMKFQSQIRTDLAVVRSSLAVLEDNFNILVENNENKVTSNKSFIFSSNKNERTTSQNQQQKPEVSKFVNSKK